MKNNLLGIKEARKANKGANLGRILTGVSLIAMMLTSMAPVGSSNGVTGCTGVGNTADTCEIENQAMQAVLCQDNPDVCAAATECGEGPWTVELEVFNDGKYKVEAKCGDEVVADCEADGNSGTGVCSDVGTDGEGTHSCTISTIRNPTAPGNTDPPYAYDCTDPPAIDRIGW